jgi:hypothetical protein
MLYPPIRKNQYNKNLELIIESNQSLCQLLNYLMTDKSVIFNQSSNELKAQLKNGISHLTNMNILIKNLKRIESGEKIWH